MGRPGGISLKLVVTLDAIRLVSWMIRLRLDA
jgi:hypothetical protein